MASNESATGVDAVDQRSIVITDGHLRIADIERHALGHINRSASHQRIGETILVAAAVNRAQYAIQTYPNAPAQAVRAWVCR